MELVVYNKYYLTKCEACCSFSYASIRTICLFKHNLPRPYAYSKSDKGTWNKKFNPDPGKQEDIDEIQQLTAEKVHHQQYYLKTIKAEHV